jgi:hypothetical protein
MLFVVINLMFLTEDPVQRSVLPQKQSATNHRNDGFNTREELTGFLQSELIPDE